MADVAKQETASPAAPTEAAPLDEFKALLEKDFRAKDGEAERIQALVQNLARAAVEQSGTATISGNVVKTIKSLVAGIDKVLSAQVDEIMHCPEMRELEGTWRGLYYLVNNTETDSKLRIRVMNITKDELADVLDDYEGRWDQSPIHKKIYDQEYSTLGGEPYGTIIGAYEFSHHPRDVNLLRGIAGTCAAAHAPFIAAASPRLYRMECWQELSNPQDLKQIVSSPDYASWRSLREDEDARYVGLTLPRVLARLPYGKQTLPVKDFDFEEETKGGHDNFIWMNAAFAMGVNINRSHKLFGWGSQIRGVENGGSVSGLPVYVFPSDSGSGMMKCPTEIAIDDRREHELARLGMMPILHRKNTDKAAFIGAHSLADDETRAGRVEDPDAKANERLTANLAYLMSVCRFAHYLKAIARDKVGSFKERSEMQVFLSEWINRYVLPNPAMANDELKAKRPLAKAEVQVDSVVGRPGYYNARFSLRPHYQLEGINASLRLVSELPTVKG